MTSKKLEVNTIEKSFITMLKSQEITYDEYAQYLKSLDKEFHSYLSITNIKELFSCDFDKFETKPIPQTTPVLPEFTAGDFRKDDFYSLFRNIHIRNIESNKIEI